MKKNLLALLVIALLTCASIYTTSQNVLAVSKQQTLVKKTSASKSTNFNNYKSIVSNKYPENHFLPFIKDYKTGLNIKQKINNDGTIHVKYDGNANLISNFQQSVNTWNKLGVIKFKIVDDSSSLVNVHGNTNSKDDFDNTNYSKGNLGDTSNYVDYGSSISLADGTKMNYISKSDIVIYSDASKLSENNKDHVIIHELGHALGFDDLYSQKYRKLVMFSNAKIGSILLNKLGSYEKDSLQHYYQ